ncbi:hypothetical protein B7463_g5050, partial [Scytalidium lignicola]
MAPSLPSTFLALALSAAGALAAVESCSNPQLSCHNSSSVANLCCFNAPGGQLVQTQFWDTSPSTGPINSWTVHGLWPDHCDGSFDQNCDSRRAYKNISSILQQYGKTDLLSYMNTFWKNDPNDGSDEEFWEHEWETHGTCISTLDTTCYSDYSPQEEVPDFFQTAVNLFKTVDTYAFLADAGIVPSSSATYTAAEIQAAIRAAFGFEATIQCSSGALDEIWYSFDVLGSVVTGTFQPATPVGQSSSCSSSGIKYLPKPSGTSISRSSTPTSTSRTSTSTTRGGSSPTPTGGFSGSGFLNAVTSGSQSGCLISSGTWFTTGTCATYTATSSGSGFTLRSSKGNCAIENSEFTCASGNTATVFTAINGLLAYSGSTAFYATAVPSGQTQATVYTSSHSTSRDSVRAVVTGARDNLGLMRQDEFWFLSCLVLFYNSYTKQDAHYEISKVLNKHWIRASNLSGYPTSPYHCPGNATLPHRVNTKLMYRALQQRSGDDVLKIEELLIRMALEPRLMPGVATEMRSVRSSASTPSLRSKEESIMPTGRMEATGGNVKVVVRVRAFLPREIERGAECLIEMDPVTQSTTLLVPNDSDPANSRSKMRKVIEEKKFTFDSSFWSHDLEDEHYAHQEDVYNCLGEEFLDHNFEGYHTCIFAYGQTGSGKSYTMMGTPDEPGLIPRTCEDLFQRIEAAQNETPNISYNVRVSYFEVYNEHVRDLLVPVNPNQPPYYLKIRESPTEGPYIKDLTDAPVKSISEIMRYMRMGDSNRTVASTKMNDTSSRSHAVFTIMLKQIHHDMDTDETTERMARIRLVDLAGSERAKATEATGVRLREGSNINKSLTTLGRVIAALADLKQHRPGKRNKDVVPYRDSILTWLLKDSLGGNSKTAMIACIAPSDYDETLSTLRYADQAKRIRTRAVVNQDHISAAARDAQIAAMAEEIRILQLSVSDNRRREKEGKEQEEKLEEYQNRVVVMQRMMEEKSMVAEGKIRSLQTENEALRLHLKLALESLKNPIEVPNPRVRVSLASIDGDSDDEMIREDETGDPSSDYDHEDEGISSSIHDERATEVQVYMKELLNDLGQNP